MISTPPASDCRCARMRWAGWRIGRDPFIDVAADDPLGRGFRRCHCRAFVDPFLLLNTSSLRCLVPGPGASGSQVAVRARSVMTDLPLVNHPTGDGDTDEPWTMRWDVAQEDGQQISGNFGRTIQPSLIP